MPSSKLIKYHKLEEDVHSVPGMNISEYMVHVKFRRCVVIDGEFLLQHKMCCLLDPHGFLEDVVSTIYHEINISLI